MERVRTLINKLQEQLEEGVEAGRLLITTQMLLAELQQQSPLASSKVSVVIPAAARMPVMAPMPPVPEMIYAPVTEPQPVTVPQEEEVVTPQWVAEPVVPEPVILPQPVVAAAVPEAMIPEPAPVPMFEQKPVAIPVPEEKVAEIHIPEEEPVDHKPFMEPAPWLAETVTNVAPTLIHQPRREAMELNETMVVQDESINDRLREKRVEVATLLQGSPVKDLRKAIGINDRYLFINELFRGDEAMYERSLKTINSYSFLPEAEYWIQRELKIKLGWDEDSATVQHFDQLVKRRFF